jgi:hypothetical protein
MKKAVRHFYCGLRRESVLIRWSGWRLIRERPNPLHVGIDGFTVNELHRVEVALVIGSQVKD